ncbi:MAG: EamA family transporter, partial [Meiothermus sp.]
MGYVYVLAAATLWGLLGSVSKLVFAQSVTPLEAAFWRA